MTAPQQIDWLAEASTAAPPAVVHTARLARRADPATSKQAAERTVAFVGKHESAIFGYLIEHPEGATYREVAAGTGLEPVAVARRMKGLRERAGVYADGERNRMTVWKVRR